MPPLVTDKPPTHLSEDFGSHTFQNLLPESPPSLFQAQASPPPPIHPPCKATPSLHGPPTVVSSCPHSLQSHLGTLSTDLTPPTLLSQALGHRIKLGSGRNSPHGLDAVLSGERISLLCLGLVTLWVSRQGQRGYHKEPLRTIKDVREPCVREGKFIRLWVWGTSQDSRSGAGTQAVLETQINEWGGNSRLSIGMGWTVTGNLV